MGEGNGEDDNVTKLLGKRKAETATKSNPVTIKKQASSSSAVSLPHLIYQLDFSENDDDLQKLWNASSEGDFLENIITQNRSGNNQTASTKKEIERKVVVVFELPSGGEVIQYCIGDTDDTLEVQVRKHGLMLNPQALLYSGLKVGALDPVKDGPLTNRGGIRLLECSKALQKYTASQKVKQDRGEKNDNNHLSLKFDLPEFVSREKAIAYSYCFDNDSNKQNGRNLQYAIAYFEFKTKEATSTEEEKFTKVSAIHFSDGNNGSSNNPSSNSGSTNFFGGSSSTSTSSSNTNNFQQQQGNHHQKSTSSTSCSTSTGASSSSSSSSKDKVLTQGELQKIRSEVEQDVSKKYKTVLERERNDYVEKLKSTRDHLFQQTQFFKKTEAERLEEINKSQAIIQKQQAELDMISRERDSIEQQYKMKYEKLQNELRAASSKEEHNTTTLSDTTSNRQIQCIPDFASAMDLKGSLTPAKRSRVVVEDNEPTKTITANENSKERSVSNASSDGIEGFLDDLHKQNNSSDDDLSFDDSSDNSNIMGQESNE